jgi:hypothetical protein
MVDGIAHLKELGHGVLKYVRVTTKTGETVIRLFPNNDDHPHDEQVWADENPVSAGFIKFDYDRRMWFRIFLKRSETLQLGPKPDEDGKLIGEGSGMEYLGTWDDTGR